MCDSPRHEAKSESESKRKEIVFNKIFAVIFLASSLASSKDLDGKTVYLTNCTACHGSLGDGRGPAAAAIPNPKPRNFLEEPLKYGDSKDQIFKTITNGIPNTAMPPWAALSEAERKAVATYIFELVEKRKKSNSGKNH